MNREDKRTLEDLIRDLLSTQDNVTHYNELGELYATDKAIRERDRIKQQLIEFVKELAE